MCDLLKQGELPARAYFADNDLIAAGALRAFKEAGYRIPKDVAIIGFDDMPVCLFAEPQLATVSIPKQYMGRMAAKRVAELIEAPDQQAVKILISGKIIERKSI